MAYKDLREFLSVSSKRMDNCSGSPNMSCPSPILIRCMRGNKTGRSVAGTPLWNIKGDKTARIAMNVHAFLAEHALALGMAQDTPLKANSLRS